MKANRRIWASAAVVLCILMTGTAGCKEKKADVESATGNLSENYFYDQPESFDESEMISQENSETEDDFEQTKEKWHRKDEQEPDNEPQVPYDEPEVSDNELEVADEQPNMPEEDPDYEPNWPEEEPNEFQQDQQWF